VPDLAAGLRGDQERAVDVAGDGLSGASLRHIHAVIRRAINVAVKWQLIAVNPAALVEAPRPAQHEVVPRFRQPKRGS